MSSFIRTICAACTAIALILSAAPSVASTYLQCAPFARAESGIQLFGNARDWWQQAAGRYERGSTPRVGAVMAFAASRAMPVGHVAVVSEIVSDREIRITHANWSPINGRRGQVERNVRAVDVSPAGDWSLVRVWYAPMGDLGLRSNAISGFIYPDAATAAPAGDAARTIAARGRAITPDADGALAAIVASLGA